jgi:hypothetical protein
MLVAIGSGSALAFPALAQEQQGRLSEPVFKVARSDLGVPSHPLDKALLLAQESLNRFRQEIHDYTATLIKRERVGTTVLDYEYMYLKVRNARVHNGRVEVPFSVYLTFLKPAEVKGREVIYVQGRNNNKLIAHEGGVKGKLLPTVSLDPTSMLAMRGNRYPITQIGIENLMLQLLERGNRDRVHPDIQVEFRENAKINDRICTTIVIRHPEQRPGMDFQIAQVFMDNEFKVPIRYAAYDFSKPGQTEPEVIEEYTYLNLKTNVGLTDRDFDQKNPGYAF